MRRPISVTTTGPVINQKMELKYEGFGTVKELKYFNNDKQIGKVVYQNQNGLPTSAMIYGSLIGLPEQPVAEVTFTYSDQKLLKISLQPKVNFLMDPSTYELDYNGGEDKLYQTYILGMIRDYIESGSPITSLPENPFMSVESKSNTIGVPTFSFEFDTKKNPFYNLPIIGAVVGNNAMASLPRPVFILDGVNFFHKNNVLVKKIDIGSGITINLKMEYTYDSQGYPTKYKTYSADGTSVFSETVIKY